ncbi:MAG TPA: hypothetical protein VMB66_02735 [Candidatus Acidoferrales bacterium]|jgi:hypothetical protein|nr:hypothetical protein [Candidatus Acidoferrales bacterium]
MRPLILIALVAFAGTVFARDKNSYQSTKLLELTDAGSGFCFVIQVGDLAYLAESSKKPGTNLTVGDPVAFRIQKNNIWIKVQRKYPIGPDTYLDPVKAKIQIRKQMTQGQQLPSCAVAISAP